MNSCSFEICSNRPDFICACIQPPAFLCANHCAIHMNSSSIYTHLVTSAYKTIIPEEKNAIINLLTSLIKRMKTLQNELLSKVERFLSTSISLNLKILEYERSLETTLEELKKNNRCLSWGTESNQEHINLEDFKGVEKNLISSKAFQSFSQALNDLNVFSKSFCLESAKSNEKLDRVLFFTTENSHDLGCFNAQTIEIEKIPLKNLNLNRWAVSICLTDDQKVFLYGGRGDIFFDDAYLINPITKTFEILPSDFKRAQASAECIKNEIYVFGGVTVLGHNTNQASKFELELKNWSIISPLPESTRNTSTLSLNQGILITGMTKNLFLYSTSQNIYKITKINFNLTAFNLLISYKNKIIIITETKVYSDTNEDFLNISQVTNKCKFGTVTSKPIFSKNGEYAYFVDYLGRVFRLNCQTLTVIGIEVKS